MHSLSRHYRSSALVASVGLSLLLGCGSSASETKPDNETQRACVPGERTIDGICLPAGVQRDGCAAGELGLQDGSCQPAGVPASACAEGFEPDGNLGCTPLMPAVACPAGQLAVPGDASCHPVLPCGAAPWGDIPVESNTVYVNGAYGGGNSDGSVTQPYTAIQEGIDGAPAGAIVAIAAGTYSEAVEVQGKAVRLWGICPSQVTIDGGVALTPLVILADASGTEVHALGLRGGDVGIAISGSEALVLQHLWVHDSPQSLQVEESLGTTQVSLQDSLLEDSTDLAIFLGGSQLTIERSLVRGLAPGAAGPFPAGINAEYDTYRLTRAGVTIRQSVIERVINAGVYVQGADVTLEGSVVRDIQPTPGEPLGGYGIAAVEVPGQIGVVQVQSSILERIPDTGIIAQTSSVLVHGTVIRDVGGITPEGASAIYVTDGPLGRSAVTITESLAERIQGAGIVTYGSDAVLEGTAIRDVFARVDLDWGFGLVIDDNRTSFQRSVAWVRGCSVERSRTLGLFVDGSDATLAGVLVRDTLPRELDQSYGRGMQLQRDPHTFNPAVVVIDSSLVENSFEAGIASAAATVAIDGTAVHHTVASLALDVFGDGIVVATSPEGPQNIGTATVSNSLVTGSSRAGLSVFGGYAELFGTGLECNTIHLDGELQGDLPYQVENRGRNQCSCGQVEEECKVLSSSLAPPLPF